MPQRPGPRVAPRHTFRSALTGLDDILRHQQRPRWEGLSYPTLVSSRFPCRGNSGPLLADHHTR